MPRSIVSFPRRPNQARAAAEAATEAHDRSPVAHGNLRPMRPALYVPYARTYRAYGDSITNGYSLSAPATEAYPVLVATQLGGLTLLNLGTSGESCTDTMARIISYNTSTHDTAILNSLMIGTNDINGGVGIDYLYGATMACLLWLGCANSRIKKPDDSGITYSGTWVQGPAYGAIYPKKTVTDGSAASCSVTGSIGYIIYAQYSAQVEADANTVEVSVDGGPFTAAALTKSAKSAQSYSFCPGVIRIPFASYGTHTVAVRCTHATTNGFLLVAIISDGSESDALPAIIAATPPIRQSVPAGDEDYRRASWAAIRRLIADRWNIVGVNMANVLPTTAFNDNLHPNAAGHVLIAPRFTAAAQAIAN